MKKPMTTKLRLEREIAEALMSCNGTPMGAKACTEVAMKHIHHEMEMAELLAEIQEHIRVSKGENEAKMFNFKYLQPFLKTKIK